MLKPRLMRKIAACLVVGILSTGAVAAAWAGDELDTGLDELAEWQTNPADDPLAVRDQVYASLDQRAEDHPVIVKTLADGTRVQRTPSAAVDSTLQVHDNISFNTYRLNADNRGCLACHDDLAETVARDSLAAYPHNELANNALGIEWTEKMCYGCHIGHFAAKYDDWASLIHGIHGSYNEKFAAMKGDCWSCHAGVTTNAGSATGQSGMQLWDDVKYNIMHGITFINADNQTGEFAWTQDKTFGADEIFAYDYMRDRTNDVAGERFGRAYLGMTPDPETDGVYDSWTIEFRGSIDNPFTMTISELIDTFGLETHTYCIECVQNGPGGSMISNTELTGIPLKPIFEYVGIQDSCLSIKAPAADGGAASIDLQWLLDHDAMLAIYANGEPFRYDDGYPIKLATGGTNGTEYRFVINAIEFVDAPFTPDKYNGTNDIDGINHIHPNAGICYLHEGQIIEMGEPFTFQGYAVAMHNSITAVEISMDRGKTWKTFETPDADDQAWVWWNYTWTPTAVGSYVIAVRSVAEDGAVGPYDMVQMMVTVEDPANPLE